MVSVIVVVLMCCCAMYRMVDVSCSVARWEELDVEMKCQWVYLKWCLSWGHFYTGPSLLNWLKFSTFKLA